MLDRNSTDDEILTELRAAPDDDLRAFELLVSRYERRVATNCRFLSGSPSDAPDLAQEVFVKIYFGLPRFEGRSSFRTWLERIKSNHCVNFVKKKRPTFLDLDAPPAERADAMRVDAEAEDLLEAEDERRRIRAVLDRLSDSLRIPLILRDMDGFSYQEIADQLGIGLSAVKMRIKRGREEFRALYEATEGASLGTETD